MVNYSGMFFSAATFFDAIEAMMLLFYLTEKFDDEFDIYINVDGSRGPSGSDWGICRGAPGYLFTLTVDDPVSGFGGHLPGETDAYKVGDDPELVDHPTIEMFQVPRHCVIDRKTVLDLLHQLRNSDDPELTGGFVFDPAHWQPVW
jgi:hypothetical protein